MNHPKFEVYKDKNDNFRFRLTAKNGQNILASEGYTTKAACLNGIESIKKNSTNENRYDKKTTDSGNFTFNIKAANSQVIGTSQTYKSESGRNNGIKSVMENAASAGIDDQTE